MFYRDNRRRPGRTEVFELWGESAPLIPRTGNNRRETRRALPGRLPSFHRGLRAVPVTPAPPAPPVAEFHQNIDY